jgi:DNA-binding transcriptional MocR family regulator
MTEFARRAALRSDPELATILAGVPPGVLSMTGGFPNPATFPTEEIAEITARLMRDEPAVALQYTPVEGLRSTREFLLDRYAPGRDLGELIVTSGGMECIQLVCQALLDPGDTVAVEAPSYLGALLAFAGAEARVEALPMDDEGLVVEALTGNPNLLYVIPEFQNPTGRTLSLERRVALVEECRRRGILIFEDVAYRELSFEPVVPHEESGGAGLYPGGEGIVREYEALAPMTFSLLTERRRHAPPGAAGGSPGAKGRNLLDGEELPSKASGELRAGQRLRIETPGGGGHGRI